MNKILIPYSREEKYMPIYCISTAIWHCQDMSLYKYCNICHCTSIAICHCSRSIIVRVLWFVIIQDLSLYKYWDLSLFKIYHCTSIVICLCSSWICLGEHHSSFLDKFVRSIFNISPKDEDIGYTFCNHLFNLEQDKTLFIICLYWVRVLCKFQTRFQELQMFPSS